MGALPRQLLFALAALSLGTLVGAGQARPAAAQAADVAIANVVDTAGQPVGTARFTQQGAQVIVEVGVGNLQPGFHGFHIHEIGVCDPAGGFTTAGGHLNPNRVIHREHSGDMPSLYANIDGTGRMTVAIDHFTVAELLAGDGSAVIVHADPDNFAWIPARYGVTPDDMTLSTGDAGARVACGVVERTAE